MKSSIRSCRTFGFTLIELLIVILIIGILAGLTVGVVKIAQRKADRAAAVSMVKALDSGLKMFESDNGFVPGRDAPVDPLDPESNVIAQVVAAVRGPYASIKEDDLYVVEVDGFLRPATKEEIDDDDIPKIVVDPWGNSYVARENQSKLKKEPWMHLEDFMDIYSTGPNGEDDTANMIEGKANDDIGNW